jgi:anti-sigma regulatory factor (Ser/Thr protein kinase)
MCEGHTLTICNSSDAIIARARVRELAREGGLDLAEQARISLATYSLANTLRMGYECSGQVVVDRLAEGKRVGMRVACITAEAAEDRLASEAFGGVRQMVDELTIETLPSNAVRVTLIQWEAPRRSGIFSDQKRPFGII